MAEDKVKKGFFFYFGLFLIAIVAAVLVIFVVMLFMPGTSILGLEYFTNNAQIRVENTTDESATQISFQNPNFDSVEINAGYSEVIIQNNNEFDYDGVYLVNTSCGFVTSNNAQEYQFSVTIEDRVLKIEVSEQPAFLYFSKNAQIVLHVSNNSLAPFAGKPITIKTTDGDVNIGGPVITGYSRDIALASLDVETQSGDILLSSHAPSSYNILSLKSGSGEISSAKSSIKAENLTLQTTSGDMSLGSIASTATMTLSSESGRLSIGEISANVSSNFKNAHVTVGQVYGNWDFAASTDMGSSVIRTTLIRGGINVPRGQDSRFEIGSVTGPANITTTSGSVSIFSDGSSGKDMTSGISANSSITTTSGRIEVVISDGATGDISLESKNGEINVHATSNFNNLTICNDTARVGLNLPRSTSLTISFARFGAGQFSLDQVAFARDDVALANPTVINGGQNSLQIFSNSTIAFNWA